MADDIGRPTVMTPEIITKLEQAFSLGASDLEACFYAGIGKTTLYEYQNKNPEYAERKAALKDKLVLKARTVLAKAMEDGDKQTAQWYLERKKKDEFSQRQEQTGADGQPLNPLPTEISVVLVRPKD